jgi:hypothetical protein
MNATTLFLASIVSLGIWVVLIWVCYLLFSKAFL